MATSAIRQASPRATSGSTPPRGWLAGLGYWSATHGRLVLVGWLMVLAVFGAFAPKVESALAGAGWQDSGSQSVRARDIVQRDFNGLGSTAIQVVLVDRDKPLAADPEAQRVIARAVDMLRSDGRVSTVVPPQGGVSLSRDGRTGVIQAGAAADPNAMVKAVDDLQQPLRDLATGAVTVQVTGSSALWSDFNAVNRSAMLRSEALSWPVTMLVLVLAFGSLVAAGLPLMLTLAGLLTAAGALVIATHIAPVSIWALNFALMFALALGIDYALFIVLRFRSALAAQIEREGPIDHPRPDRATSAAAAAEAMATAGKAVAYSAVTVLVALSTVLIVPSPAFRSMALGIMLAVVAVLAASLTLLPAALGALGPRVDAGRLRLPGAAGRGARAATRPTEQVSSPDVPDLEPTTVGLERGLHRWGGWLHARPWLAAGAVIIVLGVLAWPVTALRTGMPSIKIIPASESARMGYEEIVHAFGPGAPGMLTVLTPAADADQARSVLRDDDGIAAVLPTAQTSRGLTILSAMPSTDASAPATGATIERLRTDLPHGSLVGGAAAENFDLQHVLSQRTPLVFGLLIGLGFLLLLLALGSPLVAFVGVITNLGSIAAAFGVAELIFQDGHLSGLLNFQPQGFIDAWAPLFFGAMLTGVAMDYTLFLLSTVREHYDRTGNPHLAARLALRSSGRVVVAAAGVMVAVFLTFALSGPLAPKEMGIILAVAVFLDALCIRLILLPVVLRLTGHRAWHRPGWLDRVLPRVHFTH